MTARTFVRRVLGLAVAIAAGCATPGAHSPPPADFEEPARAGGSTEDGSPAPKKNPRVMAESSEAAGPAPLPGSADTRPRLALVIGNASYDGDARLANPLNDAHALAAALKTIGFEVTEHRNLEAIDMKDALSAFAFELRKKKGVGLFYFAGHGLQDGELSYLMPIRSTPFGPDFAKKAVSLNDVLAELSQAEDAVRIVILDACRTPPHAAPARDAVGQTFVEAPPRTLIAYATSPGHAAADGAPGGHSAYTGVLIQEITTPGWTVDQIFRSVRRKVYEGSGARQLPWEATSLFAELVLVPTDGGAPPPDPAPLAVPAQTIEGRTRGAPIAQSLDSAQNRELAALERMLEAESFSADKMAVLEFGTRDRAFTIAQVRRLIAHFDLEGDKVRVIELLRRQVSDPESLDAVLDDLSFASSKDVVRKMFRTLGVAPPLSTSELEALRGRVNAARDFRSQMEAVDAGTRGKSVTIAQVLRLISVLRTDQYRLEAVRILGNRVSDPDRADDLQPAFRGRRAKSEAVRLVR